MTQRKQILITAFALFSLFFGAGNLILPPFLGYNAGSGWVWVTIGFALSAVIIPIMAIYGHARLQGTMLDFGKKVSPGFALVYAFCVYAISIALPSPRTASVAYEMAIKPYFEMSSLMLSTIYFALVLVFALNRSKILSIIGKYLTPLIILILLAVIILGLVADTESLRESVFSNTFTEGILEGYQTFDAIGGVVVGGVIVISFALQGKYDYRAKRNMIAKSGLLAGFGLFVIYGGLIALGAFYSSAVEVSDRTELLTLLSTKTLGNVGTAFLAVLVALACFTTAVGIVTGTADFIKGLFHDSKVAYILTAVLGCLIGVLIGQRAVEYIIAVAIPALMFIYPITIVLILLSVLPKHITTSTMYRAVVVVTILFSIPDFVQSLHLQSIPRDLISTVKSFIPMANKHLGWVIPAASMFALIFIVEQFIKRNGSETS